MDDLESLKHSIGSGPGQCPADLLARLARVGRATVFRFKAGREVNTRTLRRLDEGLRAWRASHAARHDAGHADGGTPDATHPTSPESPQARAQ